MAWIVFLSVFAGYITVGGEAELNWIDWGGLGSDWIGWHGAGLRVLYTRGFYDQYLFVSERWGKGRTRGGQLVTINSEH